MIYYIIVIVIFVIILVLNKIFYHVGNTLLFHPVKCNMVIPNKLNDFDVENDFVTTSDGVKIHYIYIKNPNSNLNFLYAHGNGGNIGHNLESQTVKYLLNFGSVFMFDYRGYGKSKSVPNELGIRIDIKSVWNYMTQNMNIEPNNIVVVGTSLGCSFASWLGSDLVKNNLPLPKMIILQSGFFDIRKIAKFKFGDAIDYVGHLFDLELNNYKYIKQIKKHKNDYPILILHSKNDDVIPYFHSENLAKKTDSVMIEIGGPHNYLIIDDDANKKISEYLLV
jgi:uncharacterized protein